MPDFILFVSSILEKSLGAKFLETHDIFDFGKTIIVISFILKAIFFIYAIIFLCINILFEFLAYNELIKSQIKG